MSVCGIPVATRWSRATRSVPRITFTTVACGRVGRFPPLPVYIATPTPRSDPRAAWDSPRSTPCPADIPPRRRSRPAGPSRATIGKLCRGHRRTLRLVQQVEAAGESLHVAEEIPLSASPRNYPTSVRRWLCPSRLGIFREFESMKRDYLGEVEGLSVLPAKRVRRVDSVGVPVAAGTVGPRSSAGARCRRPGTPPHPPRSSPSHWSRRFRRSTGFYRGACKLSPRSLVLASPEHELASDSTVEK